VPFAIDELQYGGIAFGSGAQSGDPIPGMHDLPHEYSRVEHERDFL
jgi:hypothetical protein